MRRRLFGNGGAWKIDEVAFFGREWRELGVGLSPFNTNSQNLEDKDEASIFEIDVLNLSNNTRSHFLYTETDIGTGVYKKQSGNLSVNIGENIISIPNNNINYFSIRTYPYITISDEQFNNNRYSSYTLETYTEKITIIDNVECFLYNEEERITNIIDSFYNDYCYRIWHLNYQRFALANEITISKIGNSGNFSLNMYVASNHDSYL